MVQIGRIRKGHRSARHAAMIAARQEDGDGSRGAGGRGPEEGKLLAAQGVLRVRNGHHLGQRIIERGILRCLMDVSLAAALVDRLLGKARSSP